MYNKKKFIESLKAMLETISNDLSPKGKAQKEEIKKQLAKLEEKKVEPPKMEENELTRG